MELRAGNKADGDVALGDGWAVPSSRTRKGGTWPPLTNSTSPLGRKWRASEGDVLLAGDTGAEEGVDGGEGIGEGGAALDLGVHHSLNDGGEKSG